MGAFESTLAIVSGLITIGGVLWVAIRKVRTALAESNRVHSEFLEFLQDSSATVAARTELGLYLMSHILSLSFARTAAMTLQAITLVGVVGVVVLVSVEQPSGLPRMIMLAFGFLFAVLLATFWVFQIIFGRRMDKTHALVEKVLGESVRQHIKRASRRSDAPERGDAPNP